MADKLHVTRQTLSRWENNLSYPNLDTLVNLSEFLAVPLDILQSTYWLLLIEPQTSTRVYPNGLFCFCAILGITSVH